MTCQECVWWKRVTNNQAPTQGSYTFPEPKATDPSDYGECRGAPPTVLHAPIGAYTRWPIVHEAEYCGAFQRKPDAFDAALLADGGYETPILSGQVLREIAERAAKSGHMPSTGLYDPTLSSIDTPMAQSIRAQIERGGDDPFRE